jgi:hypothetical protein
MAVLTLPVLRTHRPTPKAPGTAGETAVPRAAPLRANVTALTHPHDLRSHNTRPVMRPGDRERCGHGRWRCAKPGANDGCGKDSPVDVHFRAEAPGRSQAWRPLRGPRRNPTPPRGRRRLQLRDKAAVSAPHLAGGALVRWTNLSSGPRATRAEAPLLDKRRPWLHRTERRPPRLLLVHTAVGARREPIARCRTPGPRPERARVDTTAGRSLLACGDQHTRADELRLAWVKVVWWTRSRRRTRWSSSSESRRRCGGWPRSWRVSPRRRRSLPR